ncbi:hypothetical protein ACFL7E_08975 [Thermodesulfobacteriota bacterium]
MLLELFERIPLYPRSVIEDKVSIITYGDLSMGDGWYDGGRVEISPAIRHPRLLIERTLHECGHGVEEWLSKNGYALYSCNIDQVADGFALSLLYPEILAEPDLKQIQKIYSKSLFVKGFPNIDTEGLIARYVGNAEELLEESLLRKGSEVSKTLKILFEQQKDGFLRRYSTSPDVSFEMK